MNTRSFIKYLFILAVTVFGLGCETKIAKNDSKIQFASTEYNFGELIFKGEGSCNFTFSNSGETPLLIQNVKTSCGCTVPEWPKKPIKPGENGKIEIEYDTTHPGMFQKTITVFYNGKNSPETLTIKGRVVYPDEKEVENISIGSL